MLAVLVHFQQQAKPTGAVPGLEGGAVWQQTHPGTSAIYWCHGAVWGPVLALHLLFWFNHGWQDEKK